MTDLTTAENAALVIWTANGSSRETLLAAVREAVRITERRYEMAEDAHAAILEGELAAIRDLAYRGVGSPKDALEAIHQRAVRALAGTDL